MPHIAIISSSLRIGRNSHRVALYFERFIRESGLSTAEILDLNDYRFPLFDERLRLQEKPSAEATGFARKIKSADGVLIVSPEYNGGYPASIKNVIDLLYSEWQRKPVAISTVSDGNFGAAQVIISLQFTLWKIHAWTVPATFQVPDVVNAFDQNGYPADKTATDNRAAKFISELLWCIEAKRRMEE
jgi:NAD(P)H-dependent FMN reductase